MTEDVEKLRQRTTVAEFIDLVREFNTPLKCF
jgi:hypothetical protein